MSNYPQADAFACAVARALFHWQNVETALYYSTHCILGTRQEYSTAMFYAIRSPQTKVALTEKLWQLRLSKDEYEERADDLFSTIDRLRQERDNIAHFQAQVVHDEKGRIKHRLYLPYTDPAFGKKFEYTTDDLEHLHKEMRWATDALNQLTRLYYPPSSFPKKSPALYAVRPNKRLHTRTRSDRE